jgi:hypothetical protein
MLDNEAPGIALSGSHHFLPEINVVKILVFVFTLALLLQHQPAAAVSYPVLYVAPDGRSFLPCGIDAAQPCKSLATAVSRVNVYDTTTIRVARGNYTEYIPISDTLPSLSGSELVIEGGWDAGFSSRTEDPSLTTITNQSGTSIIFYLQAGAFERIALRLENLTLRGTAQDNLNAIRTSNEHGTIQLTVSSCSLRNCSGPAVYISDLAGSTALNIERSRIENNGGNTGSGIRISGHDNADINAVFTKNRFFNNAAGNEYGGGIYFRADYGVKITASLKNNIFAGNSAALGGALGLETYSTGNVEVALTNNTITENQCQAGGGGILVSTHNQGVASLYIRNTIVWGNIGSTDLHILQNDLTSTAAVYANYSLIGIIYDGWGCYTAVETYNKDPMLGSGFRLLSGSPARDSGLCGGYLFGKYVRIAPYDDIDGDARPGYGVISGCDIGADEYTFPWFLFNPALRKQ